MSVQIAISESWFQQRSRQKIHQTVQNIQRFRFIPKTKVASAHRRQTLILWVLRTDAVTVTFLILCLRQAHVLCVLFADWIAIWGLIFCCRKTVILLVLILDWITAGCISICNRRQCSHQNNQQFHLDTIARLGFIFFYTVYKKVAAIARRIAENAV